MHTPDRTNVSSLLVSSAVHAAVLIALAAATFAVERVEDLAMIETIIPDEEREIEQFVQELDTQDVPAETFNIVAGSISTNIGGSDSPVQEQVQVEPQEVMQESEVAFSPSVQEVPVLSTLGDDLGEEEVTGEVGAVVEGYGAALDRLAQELIRLMRKQKLLVVWMFDESGSMKDDQEEIRQRIGRVYEELKLIEKDPTAVGSSQSRKLQDVLLTSVTSFGHNFHVHTPRPTSNVEDVIAAIGEIPVDETGDEFMSQALTTVLGQYGGAIRGGRKLAVVIVSDESGDDGQFVEDALAAAKKARSPLYILGRESVFGSRYAFVRWRQPETGRWYKLPIRRGPETPMPEQLQYDGFRLRDDAHMSGFGPYEQVRLARETGGIFFQLPHEQTDLNELDNRAFQMLDLKEYLPDLSARRDYMAERDASNFRKALWEVIALLDPEQKGNGWLNVPEGEWFHVDPQRSTAAVAKRLEQIAKLLTVMNLAQQRLESVRRLRAQEASRRWRANYDLIYAQLFAYRVRLFEYAIALGQFGKTMPERIKNPKSNRWSISHGSRTLILPDPQQEKALGVTGEELKEAHRRAQEQLAQVKRDHPNTPWARRAEWEEGRRYGATFAEHYVAPPKPSPRRPSKPRPKPTPPPKL